MIETCIPSGCKTDLPVPTAPDHIEISKRTIRERAIAFSRKHADDKSEAAEKQRFWIDFLSIFGVAEASEARFEFAAKRLSTGHRGYIDLLIPGEMAVEHKSAGEDLSKAMSQLFDYLDSLEPLAQPHLLIACDFQHFYWHDLNTRTQGRFTLDELSQHVELFWWLAGHRPTDVFEDEEAANLVATDYMAKLHDAVLASGYDPHALREWLTRILFCLFADDTEVWDRNAFKHYVFLRTRQDGSDLGSALDYLFQILNTPDDGRANTLDEDLASFTYINGDLFEARLSMPTCDEAIRSALLEACKFDWSAISPAIFGSMFQNVMTPAEQRQLGAHYTTEENILKTIRPLFLDDLEAELARIKVTTSARSREELDRFHDKLANLTFLDPACGCGNFLVIAYREVRRLETELLRKRAVAYKQPMDQLMDVSHVLRVTVDQFYGIEIEEFPARIARTALYLMDHKANLEVSKEFGQYFARFPIPSSPHIAIANALRIDWNDVLPASEADFIFGNPPFVGSRMETDSQREDQEGVWPGHKRRGTLDYVTNWFKRAAEYARSFDIAIAFVATNSISQGEQPAVLRTELWGQGMTIHFAHRPFAWSSEAKGTAAVHVVIVGFSSRPRPALLRLWVYPDQRGKGILTEVANISPYLIGGPDVVVSSRQRPLVNDVPPMLFGSMPRDDGILSNISPESAEAIRRNDPIASKYLRRLMGGEEFLNGVERYCLWLLDGDPTDIASSPELQKRLAAVREWRLKSKAASTRSAASSPALFVQLAQPSSRYLAVPRVSSESREYLPTAYFDSDTIVSDLLFTIQNADLTLFGVMSSRAFTAWNRTISGRLESRVRVSQEITYNNFPWLTKHHPDSGQIEQAAKEVLESRGSFQDATLAQLYNPLAMPARLLAAHRALDVAVLNAYELASSATEAEVLARLLERYESLSSGGT